MPSGLWTATPHPHRSLLWPQFWTAINLCLLPCNVPTFVICQNFLDYFPYPHQCFYLFGSCVLAVLGESEVISWDKLSSVRVASRALQRWKVVCPRAYHKQWGRQDEHWGLTGCAFVPVPSSVWVATEFQTGGY